MGFAGTFLSKKFPAPSKISLRPHIPCASGNRLCNVYGNRYRIYVLKSMPERFYSAKFLKSQISITQLIILSRKTQCNCVLIKVLLDFFHGQEFSLCENGLRPPHLSLRFPKGLSKTFIKMQLHCIFRNKIKI